MREDLTVTWLFHPHCLYCAALDPQVEAFAKEQQVTFNRVQVSLEDINAGIKIPTLYYNHPNTRHLVFIGSKCLDELRYALAKR